MVFQYLSFQRAPPNKIILSSTSSSSSSISIPISPLITNDLRSDPFQPPSPIKIQIACFHFNPNDANPKNKSFHRIGEVMQVSWEGPLSAYRTVEVPLSNLELRKVIPSVSSVKSSISAGAELRLGMWVENFDQILSRDESSSSIPKDSREISTMNGSSDCESSRINKKMRVEELDGDSGTSSKFSTSQLSAFGLSFDLANQEVDVSENIIVPVMSGSIQVVLDDAGEGKSETISGSSKKKKKQKQSKDVDQQSSPKVSFRLEGKQNQVFRFFSLVSRAGSTEIPSPEALTIERPREEETEIEGTDTDLTFEIQEVSGFELDKHIWDASLHMVRFFSKVLVSTPEEASERRTLASTLRDQFWRESSSDRTTMRVVELGSGTGLVSIALSILLSSKRSQRREAEQQSQSRDLEIFATDLPSALPLLETNLSLNSHLFDSASSRSLSDNSMTENRESVSSPSRSVKYRSIALDWEQSLPVDLKSRECDARNRSDLVLISDCTYNPAFFGPLLDTLVSLLSTSQDQDQDERYQSSAKSNRRSPASISRHQSVSTRREDVESRLAVGLDLKELDGKCLVVMSKKHRHEDEESFWTESEKRRLRWRLVEGRDGWNTVHADGREGQELEDASDANQDENSYEGWGIWIGWLD